jgi:hypothetical protein
VDLIRLAQKEKVTGSCKTNFCFYKKTNFVTTCAIIGLSSTSLDSRGSSVGIVSDYGVDGRCSIPDRGRGLSL